MGLAPRFYAVAGTAEVCAAGLGRPVSGTAPATVTETGLAFGHPDLSGRVIDEFPPRNGSHALAGGIHCPAPNVFTLDNATVHGPEGIVTVGRYVLAETLHHVAPERVGAWRDGALWMQRNQFTAVRRDQACHLLTGNCRNYYHWLLDGLARWLVYRQDMPGLLPWSGQRFQQEGPGLLPGLSARALTLSPGQAIEVGALHWCDTLTSHGTAFHPEVRAFGAAVTAQVSPGDGCDLYVSRDDTPHRPLLNQAAVEQLCQAHGFRVVRLSELRVADQVSLFASARRIVAPHGAGLANIVFCRPGCAILELHMDHYVNWCFRRLAATMQLRYGCLIGPTEPGSGNVHGRAWSVELGELSAALADQTFQAVS